MDEGLYTWAIGRELMATGRVTRRDRCVVDAAERRRALSLLQSGRASSAWKNNMLERYHIPRDSLYQVVDPRAVRPGHATHFDVVLTERERCNILAFVLQHATLDKPDYQFLDVPWWLHYPNTQRGRALRNHDLIPAE